MLHFHLQRSSLMLKTLISVLWVVTTITSDSRNPPWKNDRKQRNGCELSGWHFNLWMKKANWKKNNNTWNNARIHCLNVAVFHRHGWAESLTEIQPPYVKIICPNAYVSCFFVFAIISPDIVLRCSDKLKKNKSSLFLLQELSMNQ